MVTPERDLRFQRPARRVRVEQAIAIPPVDTRMTFEYTLDRDGSLAFGTVLHDGIERRIDDAREPAPLELADISVHEDFAQFVNVEVSDDRIAAEMMGTPIADERIVRDERGRIVSIEDVLAGTTQRHRYTDNELGDWVEDAIEIVAGDRVIGRAILTRTIEYW